MFAEFLGTFALVFAGTGAIIVNDAHSGSVTHVGIALTFGLIVMAMIYAVGDVSGAHLNPAVTLAFCAAGRFPAASILPYIISQTLGAFAASILLRLFFESHSTLGSTLPTVGIWKSFVFEMILSLMLMFVILRVSTGSKEKGITAGIAIGATVGLEALFAGPVCGASMNPIRSLAPAVLSGMTDAVWIYIAAPTIGMLLAVLFARFVEEPINPSNPGVSSHE